MSLRKMPRLSSIIPVPQSSMRKKMMLHSSSSIKIRKLSAKRMHLYCLNSKAKTMGKRMKTIRKGEIENLKIPI